MGKHKLAKKRVREAPRQARSTRDAPKKCTVCGCDLPFDDRDTCQKCFSQKAAKINKTWPTEEQKKYVMAELTEKTAHAKRDEELAKELHVLVDDIIDLMLTEGYGCCPNCCNYVELGEMRANPEDDSDTVCETCADGQGW